MTAIPTGIRARMGPRLRTLGVRTAEQALEIVLRQPEAFSDAGPDVADDLTNAIGADVAATIRSHKPPRYSLGVAGPPSQSPHLVECRRTRSSGEKK